MFLNVLSLDMWIVVIYLSITLVLGILYSGQIENIKDYAVYSRNFLDITIIATIFATLVGGFGTMGIAGKVHEVGISFTLLYSAHVLRNFLTAYIIPKNRDKLDYAISCGDIVKCFYGDTGKFWAGVFGFLALGGEVALQIKVLGNTFEYFFNISQNAGVIIGASIVIIYSVSGGIRAVTMTDLFQFGILVIAIPLACSKAIETIGGYNMFFNKIPTSHLSLIPNNGEFFKYLLPLFIVRLFTFAPELSQRVLITKNGGQFKRAMLKVVWIEIPFFIIITLIGLAGAILYPDIASKDIMPHIINTVIPVGFKGLVISGLFAVIMSTTDSMLNSASLSLSYDILGKIKGINQLKLARFVTLFLGLTSVIISIYYINLFDIVNLIVPFWACTVNIPLVMALLGFILPVNLFLVNMFAGLTSAILWNIFGNPNISPILISFLTSISLFIIFYLSIKISKIIKKT